MGIALAIQVDQREQGCDNRVGSIGRRVTCGPSGRAVDAGPAVEVGRHGTAVRLTSVTFCPRTLDRHPLATQSTRLALGIRRLRLARVFRNQRYQATEGDRRRDVFPARFTP